MILIVRCRYGKTECVRGAFKAMMYNNNPILQPKPFWLISILKFQRVSPHFPENGSVAFRSPKEQKNRQSGEKAG